MSGLPITTEGEPLSFEQQVNESPEAFEAFSVYRDMDPANRSLREVARTLSKSNALIMGWSRRDKWQQRVFDYDAWIAAERREATAGEARERGRKQAEALDAAIDVLSEPALQVAKMIKEQRMTINDDVPAHMLLGLVRESAKVLPSLIQASRLVNGMSTSNVDLHADQRGISLHKSGAELEAFLADVDDGAPELNELEPGDTT